MKKKTPYFLHNRAMIVTLDVSNSHSFQAVSFFYERHKLLNDCLLPALLPAPMGAPELERMPQNIYDVLIPSEVDPYGDTSVVFRIETETGDRYYQWMVDVEFDFPVVSVVEYLLDLSAYTGQRLNVSYAFATITGISQFSTDAVVQVPGNTQLHVHINNTLQSTVDFRHIGLVHFGQLSR